MKKTGTRAWYRLLLATAMASIVALGTGPAWAKELKLFGPGGVQGPLQECADTFARTHDIQVKVVGAHGPGWVSRAGKEADLICLGVAHLYTQFVLSHPGIVEQGSWESLSIRPAGILVRKGNPKGIKGLEDLAKPGVRLLNVACPGQVATWEDLCGRKGLIEPVLRNFAVTVPSGMKGVGVWKEDTDLDAWVTFASWHYRLKDVTDLVEIPERDNVFRGTLVAMTTRCKDREAAGRFIEFLKSEQGRRIFRRWGWK
jgi:accessory colonization factor AcfC